jgi:hypothetical protein
MENQIVYKKNRDLSRNKTMKGGINNPTQKITFTLFVGKDGMYLQTPDIVTVENTDIVTKGTKITKNGLKSEIGKVFKEVITKYKTSLKSNDTLQSTQKVSDVQNGTQTGTKPDTTNTTGTQPGTGSIAQTGKQPDTTNTTATKPVTQTDTTGTTDAQSVAKPVTESVEKLDTTNTTGTESDTTNTTVAQTDTKLEVKNITGVNNDDVAVAVAVTVANPVANADVVANADTDNQSTTEEEKYDDPIDYIANENANEVMEKVEESQKKTWRQRISSLIDQSDKKTKETFEKAKRESFVPSYLIKEVIICSNDRIDYIRNATSLCKTGMKSYKCIMPTIFSLPSCLKYDPPIDLPPEVAPFWKVSDNNEDPLRTWILDFCVKLEYFYNQNKSYAGVTTGGGLFGSIRNSINSTVKNIGDKISTKYNDLKDYDKKINNKIDELKKYHIFIKDFSGKLPSQLNYIKISSIYNEIEKFKIIVFFNSTIYEESTIFSEYTSAIKFNKNNPLGIINGSQIVQINPLLSKIGIIVNNIRNDLYIVYSFYNLYLKHDTDKIIKIQKRIFEVIDNVDAALVQRADEVNHHYSKTIIDGLKIISKEIVGVSPQKTEDKNRNLFKFDEDTLKLIMSEYKDIMKEWHKEYRKYIKTYEESIKNLLDRVEKSNEIFKSLHDDMKKTEYKVNHSNSSRIWNTWSKTENKKYLEEIEKDFDTYYKPQTQNFDKLKKEYENNLKLLDENIKKLQEEFNTQETNFNKEKAQIEEDISSLELELAQNNKTIKSTVNKISDETLSELNENNTKIETEISEKRTIIYNKEKDLKNKKDDLDQLERNKNNTTAPESLDKKGSIYEQTKFNIGHFNKTGLSNDQLYKIFLCDVNVYERAYGRALNVKFSNIINLRFSLCNETRLTQFFNKSGVNYAIGGVNMVTNSVFRGISIGIGFGMVLLFVFFYGLPAFITQGSSGGQKTMKRKVNQNVKKRKTGKIRKAIENDIINNID